MRNHLTSLLLSFIYGSSAAPDPIRLGLEAISARWFRGVWISGIVVAIGCMFEIWEVAFDLKNWRRHRKKLPLLPENPGSWMYPMAALGLFLVVGGIVSETIFEVLSSSSDAAIRSHESDKITTAESDAADATTKATELGNETQGLKTDAANAKRDMVKAQLELARLTGPIHVVRVINDVARPDPMKGIKQRVLLRSNTVIVFPKLPKGKSLDWTLLLTQDEVGNRQFGTVPKVMPGGDAKSPFGYSLFLDPLSTCTLDLTSDEHGTIDRTFGGASCPNTPTSK